MIVYTIKVMILKCHIVMFFLFWDVRNVKIDFMVNVQNGNIKRKIYTEKRINISLKDISIALNNHGQHGLYSF